MTIEELYSNYKLDTVEGQRARALIGQTHWYSSIVQPWMNTEQTDDGQPGFDPRTGEAPSLPLNVVLKRLSQSSTPLVHKDRLWRITEHARPSLIKLFRELNEAPRRENAIMPLRAVRELDMASFMSLSRRPGRNIREKLAGKPYLLAVRHYQTVDLSENRLLKAFSERLCELLELRAKCLDEQPDDLVLLIRSWLNSDEAKSIGRWDNLPPNNTLLSHRHYRAIYDAWGWLKSLDEDLSRDMSKFDERQETMENWLQCGKMYASWKFVFAEMPVLFNYDTFEMHYWTEKTGKLAIIKSQTTEEPSASINAQYVAACIDFTEMFPSYAGCSDFRNDEPTIGKSKHLPWPFIWQRWQTEEQAKKVDITLFDAKVAYLHSDAITISAPDLFFSDNKAAEHLTLAARSFATKLRMEFGNIPLIWLLPDYLNDFELEITRRSLNASFPDASPLPRSIAAVFEKVNYHEINNGYTIVALDIIGGKQCAIKLEASYDEELKKKVPETLGYYWERHLPQVVTNGGLGSADSQEGQEEAKEYELDIVHMDAEGRWQLPKRYNKPVPCTQMQLQKIVGKFNRLINISDSPVAGGLRLYTLQKQAGNIALWRDQIPELKIGRALVNGRYTSFPLVSRNRTVQPIRGRAIPIQVKGEFTIPPNSDSLPLYIGENEQELGFSAKFVSPDFPLKKPLTCQLVLTFTYGADNPYNLVLKPTEAGYHKINVRWEKSIDKIISNAPAPEYPQLSTWDYLQAFPDREKTGVTNLLEQAVKVDKIFSNLLDEIQQNRVKGVIISDWKEDENHRLFTYVQPDTLDESIRVYGNDFIANKYPKISRVSFILKPIDNNSPSGIICEPWHMSRKETYISTVQLDNGEQYQINEKYLVKGLSIRKLVVGTRVWFKLKEYDWGILPLNIDCQQPPKLYSAYRLQEEKYNPYSSLNKVQFLFIQIWRDGLSLSDEECPTFFKQEMPNVLAYMERLLNQDEIPNRLKYNIQALLAYTHKDAPSECVSWLLHNCLDNENIYDKRAVGFALGDVSSDWQRQMWDALIANNSNDSLRVFAYAVWRERHFVERFSFEECNMILGRLHSLLDKMIDSSPLNNEYNISIAKWTRSMREPLELLLGMLRTRSSSNTNIRMMLQPHQQITKDFAKQIDCICDIVFKGKIKLLSRVQLGNLPHKAEGDLTPDLLYALRLYLTGDDGANAIRITGVSEDNED